MVMSPELRDRIRSVYQEQRRNPIDVARLSGLLTQAGFAYEPQSQQITWETQEQDFELFDALLHFLRTTVQYEDDAFERALTTFWEELFTPWKEQGTPRYTDTTLPLLLRLQDPDIPRSLAHQPRTPFEHSLDVLFRVGLSERLLSGELVNELDVYRLRLAAILHDIGKVVIAQHDYNHDHGFISALILESYLRSRELHSDSLVTLVSVIRNHHVLELLNTDREALTVEEAMQLIAVTSNDDGTTYSFAEVLRFQVALALADTLSVPDYQVFSISVIRSFYAMYERVSPEDKEYLAPFLGQLCELVPSLMLRVTGRNGVSEAQ